MKTKTLKISWIILLVVHCFVIISGLIMAFAPTFFLVGEFQGYTGQQWVEFAESNPKATAFFLLEGTQGGLFMTTFGIALVIITLFAYRKGEKWAWYLFLMCNTLEWGSSLGCNIPTGNMQLVAAAGVLLLIAYIGLAIGVNPLLKESDTHHEEYRKFK